MKINIDEKKYKIEKRKGFQGDFSYKVTQKKRTCFVCKKGFDSVGNETLSWYDDEGFYRIKYFCNEHYRLARRLLVESKRKALD